KTDFEHLTNDEKEDIVGHIFDLSQSFNIFMRDLLEWSKSQSMDWKIQSNKINLNEILNKLIDVLKPILNVKKQIIKVDIDPHLFMVSDRYMFEVILRNLVYNAIKHSQENGLIEIKVTQNKLKISNPGVMEQIDFYNNEFSNSSNS